LFDVFVVMVGGFIAGAGIWRLMLGLRRSDQRRLRQTLTIPAVEVVAGVGLSLWILLPGSLARLLAFLAGTGGVVATSYLRLAEPRRQDPASGTRS